MMWKLGVEFISRSELSLKSGWKLLLSKINIVEQSEFVRGNIFIHEYYFEMQTCCKMNAERVFYFHNTAMLMLYLFR